jgi:hypothetical protein
MIVIPGRGEESAAPMVSFDSQSLNPVMVSGARGRRATAAPLFAKIASEDSSQFEEHTAMPGRSDCPTELEWPKDCVGYECNHGVAWRC